MKSDKDKTCVDCLHCKVSMQSTDNYRLCFCSEQSVKQNYPELYWQNKTVCPQFNDMD